MAVSSTFPMKYLLRGIEGEIPDAKIRETIDFFLSLLSSFNVRSVVVFGGCVREPDRVHSDVDLLLTIDKLPDSDMERRLMLLSDDIKKAMDEFPELSLIDCFFTDGEVVVSFNPELQFLPVFQMTTIPKNGGLDDDDTDIYIGPTGEPATIFYR